jgi:hypothetical protein
LWSKSFPREERAPDQQDAYAAAAWLRQADLEGNLNKFFKPFLLPGQYPVAEIEGWILGIM